MSRQLLLLILVMCATAINAGSQTSLSLSSPCELDQEAATGSRISVRVKGTLSSGFERSVLTDPRCVNAYVWVELALAKDANKEKLKTILKRSGKATVILVGDLYGPPTPDANLPARLRDASKPGWGHLGAFRTKIVVKEIESVTDLQNAQ